MKELGLLHVSHLRWESGSRGPMFSFSSRIMHSTGHHATARTKCSKFPEEKGIRRGSVFFFLSICVRRERDRRRAFPFHQFIVSLPAGMSGIVLRFTFLRKGKSNETGFRVLRGKLCTE